MSTKIYGLSISIPLFIALLLVSSGCNRQKPTPEGILAEAQSKIQNNDMEAARDTLIEAAAMHPQSITAHVNLGLIYWKLGDLTAAAAALNRATELAPDDPRIWEMLGLLLIETGNCEGAQEVLAKIAKPTEVTLTLKALAAQETGNIELAQHNLERALKSNKFYPPALYNLAVLQRDGLNAPHEALATYRQFREAAPRNPRAFASDDAFISVEPENITLQDVAIQNTNFSAPDIEPPPTEATIKSPNEPPVTPPLALPANNDPLTSSPRETIAIPSPAPAPAPRKSPVRNLLKKADTEIAAGNNDAALLTLKNAVQLYPDNADAVWALAVFYDKQLGLKERADGLYRTFLNMFSDDPRAASLKRTSATPTARQTPSPTTVQPSGENFFKEGLDHYSRQEWDAAITANRQALSIDPKSASCAYNLGLTYKAKNDLDAAAATFRHALNLEPDMVKSLYMLGLTEINRKRNADALTHLNRLISIQPDFAKAHYLLGTVYQAESRPDMAAIHFDRFLNLDPSDGAAPQVRRWLEQYRRRAVN